MGLWAEFDHAGEGVWRVRGFYGSPNNLALYLGRVFPLAWQVAAWLEKGGRRRWVYALAAVVIWWPFC